MTYRIDSQLSENQIESDVSSYLGYITPIWRKRYRLIKVDEQLTGADKLFDRFVPIYLQFKVSHGLKPSSSIIHRYRNKPLTNIIDFRNRNNLSGNPILYFPLRRQAKTASDLQHNILFKLNTPPFQYSLYVAPLTLDLLDYEEQLNSDWFMKLYPYDPLIRRESTVYDTFGRQQLQFGLVPFLRHHISIPPHTLVNTHEHHYSYSKSGDVVWHSGEMLSGDFRLSTRLSEIINYLDREDSGITQTRFSQFIEMFDRETRILDYEEFSDNNPVSKIVSFSNKLREKFGIRMLLLTESKD